LLYIGIDYDSINFRGFETDEVRHMALQDMSARELATQMTWVIQASGGSKSDRTVMMKSDVCGQTVIGKKEVETHGKITGHSKFSQGKL
jgi:hypothetical protein